MQKAKNDYTPQGSLRKKMVISVLGVLSLFMALGIVLMMIERQTRSGAFVIDMPDEIMPTVEYLREHPQPTPQFLEIDHPRRAEHGERIDLCVWDREFTDPFETSRFYVNGTRIPAVWIDRPLTSLFIEGQDSQLGRKACIRVPYRTGFYLIGFQRSVWLPNPIYEWVIEVK